jgi:large subunit ribosomal protein L3
LNPGAEEELQAALKAAENETDPQRKKMMFKETNVKFTVKKYLKEFKLDDADKMNVGDEIKADIFAAGDKVDVTGTSKGHGFSGVIKRWGAHRLRMSHGTGPVHRQVGSMGANSDPSRVYKNKKMAGQYGRDKVTTLNLKVVKVDAEKNLIAIKGAVPGARGSIVFIRNTVK